MKDYAVIVTDNESGKVTELHWCDTREEADSKRTEIVRELFSVGTQSDYYVWAYAAVESMPL